MRILVTGGRGKVGRATVDALLGGRPRRDRDRPRGARVRAPRPRRGRLRADRPHRRGRGLRGRARPRRGDPRGGDPRADPQPGARGLPQQPHVDVQRARGGGALGGAALRQRLVRDGAGLVLRRAALPARLPARRRGAPAAPAGPVRHVEGLRRAAHGRGRPPLGHPLHLRSPVVGAVGGQHRAQPRRRSSAAGATSRAPASGATSTSTTSPRCCASRPSPTCPATRSSTPRSPTTRAGLPLADLVRRHHGDAIALRDVDRPDAAGISTAKAQRMLGWKPTRSWRDYLDETGATRSR